MDDDPHDTTPRPAEWYEAQEPTKVDLDRLTLMAVLSVAFWVVVGCVIIWLLW